MIWVKLLIMVWIVYHLLLLAWAVHWKLPTSIISTTLIVKILVHLVAWLGLIHFTSEPACYISEGLLVWLITPTLSPESIAAILNNLKWLIVLGEVVNDLDVLV